MQKVAAKLIEGCQRAVKNEMKFSLQEAEMDEYPSADDIGEWLEELVEKKMKGKIYNEKAVEGMKKAWEKKNPGQPFQMKPQFSDLLNIIIIPCTDTIIIAYVMPTSFPFTVNKLNELDSEVEVDTRTIFYRFQPSTDPFKDKDLVRQNVLTELKLQGVYVEDEDDEEIVNYLDSEFAE